MPSPQPPVLLIDNLFDRINLYPGSTLLSSTSVVGREVQFVGDYRRERTYYQATAVADDQFVSVDSGAPNTNTVDSVWIDRGHNLWNVLVAVENSPDGAVWTNVFNAVVPALGTVGGDPTTGWCVTEEGALYALFTVSTGRRFFRLRFAIVMQPLVTGVILGRRTQLLNYSSIRDEDAGERSNRIEKSLVPGYEGRDRAYARRTINLKLSTIGATEYDSSIRQLRRVLFETDQPAVVIHNYGTNPERAWLYQYEGPTWSSPMTRVLRDLGLPMSEVGPLIR